MCHMSNVRCHMSGVRCHMSGVRCQVLDYIFFFWQSREASRLRVCYQWGLPHLVFKEQTECLYNKPYPFSNPIPIMLRACYGFIYQTDIYGSLYQTKNLHTIWHSSRSSHSIKTLSLHGVKHILGKVLPMLVEMDKVVCGPINRTIRKSTLFQFPNSQAHGLSRLARSEGGGV